MQVKVLTKASDAVGHTLHEDCSHACAVLIDDIPIGRARVGKLLNACRFEACKEKARDMIRDTPVTLAYNVAEALRPLRQRRRTDREILVTAHRPSHLLRRDITPGWIACADTLPPYAPSVSLALFQVSMDRHRHAYFQIIYVSIMAVLAS